MNSTRLTVGWILVGLVLGLGLAPWLTGTARGETEETATSADAVEYNLYLPPANPRPEKVVAKLDELGAKGWRLVTTTSANGGTSGFVFMRHRK